MKRRLLIIAIFLLAGAVVNVAVAWGCVAVIEPASGREIAPAEIRAIMGKQRQVNWPTVISGYRYCSFGRERVVLSEAVFPRRRGVVRPTPDHDFLRRETCGWPCRSVRAERWHEQFVYALQGGRLKRSRGLPVVLYAPIWPGFAINTIFYAAILWLLAWGAFALRRFLRLRRGLCPKCAYPMGESAVCSECGKPLPSPT